MSRSAATSTSLHSRIRAVFAPPDGYRLDLTVLFFSTFCFLIAFIRWFDNSQAITSNGVFKALTIRSWMADPANATLDASNYLYYPAMALLCRLLDVLGILPGDPRHQLSIINAFFAACSLCIVYRLVLHLTGHRGAAWAASLFHLACAFFLHLAISNEDILPSYTILLGAMALACVWFPAPTWRRVSVVAVTFTLAWMFEWRLMFPTLPGLLLALMIGPGTMMLRLSRALLFLGVMVGLAQVAILLWGPQNGNLGPVKDLLWTGKGIGEGWAGFSIAKATFLWVGLTQYVAGGINLGDLTYLPSMLTEMRWTTLFLLTVAGLSLTILWRHRGSIELRMAAVIFGTTFIAGEAMNLYSQPQDPQMQLNVMSWLPIGFALIVASPGRRYAGLSTSFAVILSFALLHYNVGRMVPVRGADTHWRNVLQRAEQQFDPARTVFVAHGFDQIVSEMFYQWDGDWKGLGGLGPAPAARPKLKMFALVNSFVHNPTATADELTAALRSQIIRLMDLGYDVIVNNVWDMSREQFVSSMSTIASTGKAEALYQMLHESFAASLAYTDPAAGPYYRLKVRSPSQ